MTKTTKCQCDSPGFCPLLRRECDPPEGRKMSPGRHNECQNKPHYFEMFLSETRRPCGPRQRPKRKRGLGDIIAAVLRFVGVTPERVEKVTGKPCGCKKRQEKLNRFGCLVSRFFT